MSGLHRLFLEGMLAVLEEDRPAGTRAADEILQIWKLRDPCATYYLARTLAAFEHPRAIEIFRRAVEGGFHPYSFYQRDPWLDSLRAEAAFNDIMAGVAREYRDAVDAFLGAGGERILGPIGASE
jgi:hypothetical protein